MTARGIDPEDRHYKRAIHIATEFALQIHGPDFHLDTGKIYRGGLVQAIATALREAEAAGAARENEAVVAWLRARADKSEAMNTPPSPLFTGGIYSTRDAADAIERGDHRSRQSPEAP